MTRYQFDPVTIKDLLSPEECDRVIAYGKSLGLEDGKAYFPREGEVQRVDKNIRNCQCNVLPHNDDTKWLVDRVNKAIALMNSEFQFDLSDTIPVEMMFVEYPRGGKFGLHVDNMAAVSCRKVSSSIQLSRSEDYEGGDLVVVGSPQMSESRDYGCMTGFPAFMPHKVRRVDSGIRYCLVVWAFGDRHFK